MPTSSRAKQSKAGKPALKLVASGGLSVASEKPVMLRDPQPMPGGYTSEFRNEVAAMVDEQLVFYRSHLQSDLYTIERELRRREEERDVEHKRARRALVAADEQIKPGQVLISEAGTPIEFIYKGTAWDMTAAAATRRGVPHLANRSVCYAHGKPAAAGEEGAMPQMLAADDSTALPKRSTWKKRLADT